MATEPYAEVTQSGRHSWAVRIFDGLMQYGPNGGPWIVFGGRQRAERKARRELDRYRRQIRRQEERVEVR